MTILTIEIDHEERTLKTHIRAIDDADDMDKLDGYYRLLKCRYIDMAEIDVDGHTYDVVCDDGAMFRQPLVPTLYISDEQVFFGNIAFVKTDEEGGSVGLSREDILRLLGFIGRQKGQLCRWSAEQRKREQSPTTKRN